LTKVLIAGFKHETNTFCSLPADMNAYRARALYQEGEVRGNFLNTRTEIAAFLDFAKTEGWGIRHPIHANATPSGPVKKDVFDFVCDRILDCICDNEPFDAVLLCLHGAMVCEHTEDGEGELLGVIRGRLGPDVIVAATLDLHANVTDRMAELADILIPYRTYPHIDQYEVGLEVAGFVPGPILAGDKTAVGNRETFVVGKSTGILNLQSSSLVSSCGKNGCGNQLMGIEL